MSEENNDQNQDTGQDAPTWENILEGLPEEQQALYEGHTQGLRSALESERRAHKDLAGQLREATQQAEEGSELRTQLEQLEAQLEEQTRRADFATEAHSQGVANVRLAWLAAQEFDAINRRGQINWQALREGAPELFAQQPAARGNAGNGTKAPPATTGMNAFIRRSAGR